MSARKVRPKKGDLVTPEMSMRDIASSLGVSKSWLSRCKQLAAIPEKTFESILEGSKRTLTLLTAQQLIDLSLGVDRSKQKRQRVCPHCGKPAGRR